MKVSFGQKSFTCNPFPLKLAELKTFVESNFEEEEEECSSLMDSKPNLVWAEIEASFFDSEGDQNVLSDEDDLKVAQRYRDVKKLPMLEININKRQRVMPQIQPTSFEAIVRPKVVSTQPDQIRVASTKSITQVIPPKSQMVHEESKVEPTQSVQQKPSEILPIESNLAQQFEFEEIKEEDSNKLKGLDMHRMESQISSPSKGDDESEDSDDDIFQQSIRQIARQVIAQEIQTTSTLAKSSVVASIDPMEKLKLQEEARKELLTPIHTSQPEIPPPQVVIPEPEVIEEPEPSIVEPVVILEEQKVEEPIEKKPVKIKFKNKMGKVTSKQASLITKAKRGQVNCLKWVITNASKLPWPVKPLIQINQEEPIEFDVILQPGEEYLYTYEFQIPAEFPNSFYNVKISLLHPVKKEAFGEQLQGIIQQEDDESDSEGEDLEAGDKSSNSSNYESPNKLIDKTCLNALTQIDNLLSDNLLNDDDNLQISMYESQPSYKEDEDMHEIRMNAEQEKQKHLLEFQDIIKQSQAEGHGQAEMDEEDRKKLERAKQLLSLDETKHPFDYKEHQRDSSQ